MTSPVSLKLKTISGHRPGPRLLITGGVHGDEFEPMSAIRTLGHTLKADHLAGSVTLVPVVNEPAFNRSQRTAEDNLDLARTCPGKSDGSITERTAYALSALIHAADYYIDLHTGGTIFDVFPLAGYCLVDNPSILDTQRRMARAFNLPLIWGTTARLQGRSLSVARDAGVSAIYAEWRGAAVCDPRGVEAYTQGCLNVMAALGMIDPPPSSDLANLVRHVVEDDRDNSGHLQILNPAPIAGQFTPAVKLGQIVAPGDLLGSVTDVLGDHTAQVRTAHGGLVNLLRSFPRVNSGDALASVVELDRK